MDTLTRTKLFDSIRSTNRVRGGPVGPVAELAPVLLGHQVVLHATFEVDLGELAAGGVLLAFVVQTQHVIEHGSLALAFVVEGERALDGRRRREARLIRARRRHQSLLLPSLLALLLSGRWLMPLQLIYRLLPILRILLETLGQQRLRRLVSRHRLVEMVYGETEQDANTKERLTQLRFSHHQISPIRPYPLPSTVASLPSLVESRRAVRETRCPQNRSTS